MKVPFLDLNAAHAPIRAELQAAIGSVIDRSAFAGGPFVAEFEADFASYCGCRHAVGVGNGTDALWLILLALGIGPGDEVITAANTFIATAEAISFAGATPVLVDVDATSYTMDPDRLEAAITPRTKAVIPVHLYGQPADMDPIGAIAGRHGLAVVEDACQAHGARYKGRPAGSLGRAAAFSFYPGKNLGALGEAGAVVTNDAALADRIRMFRDHGQSAKYHHDVVGWNARMDGIQGAALRIKLRSLDPGNAARRGHAALYAASLAGLAQVRPPVELPYAGHVYHLYVIRAHDRARLTRAFDEAGIGYGIHYPVPLHLQRAYASLGLARGAFPVSEACAQEIVSLPMYPELSRAQVQHVADCIRRVYGPAGA